VVQVQGSAVRNLSRSDLPTGNYCLIIRWRLSELWQLRPVACRALMQGATVSRSMHSLIESSIKPYIIHVTHT
jgi:hypothetical protein